MKNTLILFITIFFLLSCEEDNDLVLWDSYPEEIEEAIPIFQFTENPSYQSLIAEYDLNAYFFVKYNDSIITQNTEVSGNKIETNVYASFEKSISNNIFDVVQFNELDMEFGENRIWPLHLLGIENYDIYSQENHIKFSPEKNEITFKNPDKFENLKFDKESYSVGDTIIITWDNLNSDKNITYNLGFTSIKYDVDSIPEFINSSSLLNYSSIKNNAKLLIKPEDYESLIDKNGDKHLVYLDLQKQDIRLENSSEHKFLVVSAYEQSVWFVIDRQAQTN